MRREQQRLRSEVLRVQIARGVGGTRSPRSCVDGRRRRNFVTIIMGHWVFSESEGGARVEPAALRCGGEACHFRGGCFCGLGLVYSNKSCSMPPITFQDLPLNIYMVIFGTGIFVFILSLIFCCYFISKLRHQAQSERFGYREVVLKGDPKKLNLHGQTCAVCLEDFKVKDELGVLPCQHAFHRKCLVKWLEVRCVCPMCNKPISGPPEQHHSIGTLLDELV
ncbi:RING finger protein 122 [Merluccius polli]|uniref:RING finger protein 122 n=2 Tax=Gadoidei TaxID=1489845 RepID=A0AA47NV76_MERPO|nr:RING finger protein 122 [Merluccius polli]